MMTEFKDTAEFLIDFGPTSQEVKGNKNLAPDSISYETGLLPVNVPVDVNGNVMTGPTYDGCASLKSTYQWVGPKEQ